MERAKLKTAVLALLDALFDRHPLGHQGVYAARYIRLLPTGATAEIMFEKSEFSPPNLWVAAARVKPLVGGSIKQTQSPACDLRMKPGINGTPVYGRHSALESMPALGYADLICFKPSSLEEVGRIIDSVLLP